MRLPHMRLPRFPVSLRWGFALATPSLLAALVGVAPHPSRAGSNAALGDPLPGLTKTQLALFQQGRDTFQEVESAQADGLGPVFNAKSCAECHIQGAVGGAGFDLDVSREIRIGAVHNGVFTSLPEIGGPVMQKRSIREELPDCPIGPEVAPLLSPDGDPILISQRITTPVFGAGLIEAIPEANILRNADPNDRNHDGISGVPNWVSNPETGRTEIGRFGWKAQHSTPHVFAGDAYLNEMGISNPSFPGELGTDDLLAQGQPTPAAYDFVHGLEDDGTDVNHFTDFMRLLAPPAPRVTDRARFADGRREFARAGCTGCHTPRLYTGDSPIAALRFKPVDLYSDLLLHDMGPGLADGHVQGTSTGSQWRTAPLWGVGVRKFLLHDGRAMTVEAAVAAHGGEATTARHRFEALSPDRQRTLVDFVESL